MLDLFAKDALRQWWKVLFVGVAVVVKVAEFVLEAGGEYPGVQVPKGVYHTCVCLEPGSVIFEAKDRPYDPVET